jgi:hypothetical protein
VEGSGRINYVAGLGAGLERIADAIEKVAIAVEKRDEYERLADDHARLTIENMELRATLKRQPGFQHLDDPDD